MNTDDSKLIKRAAAGDTDAFGEFARRHKQAVHAFIIGRIRRFHDAEDLTQETFLAAFLSLHRLREPERAGTWLFGIAANLSAEWLRRKGRDEKLFDRSRADTEHHSIESSEPGNHHDTQALAALHSLPEPAATALALYYGGGLTQRECAEFLDMNPKAFESRLNRARQSLQREILDMTADTMKRHTPGDSFDTVLTEEIQKLVNVVGGHYRKKPVKEAEERLGLLYARNDRHLADLIADANTPEELRAARRMVAKLGDQGVSIALSMTLCDDECIRRNALLSLTPPAEGDETHGLQIYAVMDQILRADYTHDEKAAVVIDLIQRPSILDEPISTPDRDAYARESMFYMELLGSLEASPAERIVARLRVSPDPWLVRALVSLGNDGLYSLEPLLHGSGNDQRTGLTVVNAFGEARMHLFSLLRENKWRHADERDLPILARDIGKPLLPPSHFDTSIWQRIGLRVAEIVHSSEALRQYALHALGHFTDDTVLNTLTAALRGNEEHARTGARSLGQYFRPERVGILVHATQEGPMTVRREAHDALRKILRMCEQEFGMSESLFAAETDAVKATAAEIRGRKDEILHAVAALSLPTGPWMNSPVLNPLSREKPVPRIRHESIDGTDRSSQRQAFAERARKFHESRPDILNRHPASPPVFVDSTAALARRLPEDRDYGEREMTDIAVGVSLENALARSRMVSEQWMIRQNGTYTFTDHGRTAWRMERFLAGLSAD